MNDPAILKKSKRERALSRQDRLLKRSANCHTRQSEDIALKRKDPPVRQSATPGVAKRRKYHSEPDPLDEAHLKRVVRGKDDYNWLSEMRDDFIRILRSAEGQGNDYIQEKVMRTKKYWSEQTALPKCKFDELWSDVRAAAQDARRRSRQKDGASNSNQKDEPSEAEGENPWSRLWMNNGCQVEEYCFKEWNKMQREGNIGWFRFVWAVH
mmetsp:Transcript_14399/g.42219  ORF Transcript_14399/g.42219 Transcript_14399/m.42219 type:complete len:210 (+) Transcript_14399:286-915(+)